MPFFWPDEFFPCHHMETNFPSLFRDDFPPELPCKAVFSVSTATDFNLKKFGRKCSYCVRIMHLIRHFKRILCMALKKIVWTVFSIQAPPRPKITLLNLGIHQFSYSERLIHSERHLKWKLCIEFKKSLKPFLIERISSET